MTEHDPIGLGTHADDLYNELRVVARKLRNECARHGRLPEYYHMAVRAIGDPDRAREWAE